MLPDSLVLLKSIDLGDLAVVVHLEEPIVNETGNLTFKVDLVTESLLKHVVFRLHLSSLGEKMFNVFKLLFLSGFIFSNFFSSSSPFC
jgi:hypothetical protein